MRTRYDNVTVDPDRHGKLRARYRKGGKTIYLTALPDQPGFEAELDGVRAASKAVTVHHKQGSINDLCARYYACADFKVKGNADTRARRRGIIEWFRVLTGNDMVADFGFEHIEAILLKKTRKVLGDKGRTIGGEVAARKLHKELRRLFAYAKKLKMIASNPVEEAERIGKARLTGFYPWSEADIARYKARHHVGTKARLALEIILWTAQRRGDARLFGPRHVAGGRASFTPGKTGRGMGMILAPDLRAAIDAMPSIGISTYLVTDWGKPFSKDGFGNKFREWCDEAGLPQCTAHGLRKAAARRAAETEATQQQLKAVGGWRGDSEVTIYTESVEQSRLADAAITRMIERFSDDKAP